MAVSCGFLFSLFSGVCFCFPAFTHVVRKLCVNPKAVFRPLGMGDGPLPASPPAVLPGEAELPLFSVRKYRESGFRFSGCGCWDGAAWADLHKGKPKAAPWPYCGFPVPDGGRKAPGGPSGALLAPTWTAGSILVQSFNKTKPKWPFFGPKIKHFPRVAATTRGRPPRRTRENESGPPAHFINRTNVRYIKQKRAEFLL